MLLKSVQQNHVAHAQLFLRQEGSANLALALAYATYINCENRQPHDSCGTCGGCAKMNKLVHPDLNFVMPVTTTNSTSTDPRRLPKLCAAAFMAARHSRLLPAIR